MYPSQHKSTTGLLSWTYLLGVVSPLVMLEVPGVLVICFVHAAVRLFGLCDFRHDMIFVAGTPEQSFLMSGCTALLRKLFPAKANTGRRKKKNFIRVSFIDDPILFILELPYS